MSRLVIAAVVAALVTPPVVARKPQPIVVETAAVGDKPTVSIDPHKAYIVVRSAIGPTPFYLMKVPTADEQAAYDRLWREEFTKARAKYVKKQAEYEQDLVAARTQPPGTARKPEKPVEPTEATFQIKPIGVMAQVQFGPQFRFAKGDGQSIYLQAVTPGWYRLYGSMIANDQGAAGTCYCMGSIKFEAKAGEIVDLGTIKPRDHPPVAPPGDSSFPLYDASASLFTPTRPDEAVDPRLRSLKVVPAAFRPVGKLPNYYGVTIARVPAIPGVMRCDRDQIVDLTADR